MQTIDIFITDAQSKPLPGASIKFRLNGKDAGEVFNAQGRGRIENVPNGSSVEVIATYEGVEKRVPLAQGQTNYTIQFEVTQGVNENTILWVGLGLVILAVFLAFSGMAKDALQYKVIMALLCVGLAGIATRITGFLRTDLNLGKRMVIGAGGAFALFVILWFTSPK